MFLCMYECIAFVIGCFPLECVPFFLEICVGMTVKREIKVDKFPTCFYVTYSSQILFWVFAIGPAIGDGLCH